MNNSNNPSSTVSSTVNDTSKQYDCPPPIPPRASLLNTTNKPVEGQFVRPGETPIKAKRQIFRSRNVRRREPLATSSTTPKSISKHARSDSADALSVPSRNNHQNTNRVIKVQVDKAANSD